MRTRKEIEQELVELKHQLSDLSQRNDELKKVMQDSSEESTSKQMFMLLKYMMDENKKTTMVLSQILNSISRMEETDEGYEETEYASAQNAQMQLQNQIVLSEVDTKILQFIQISHNSMACAEDVMAQMGYGCRNAASARLNRMYRLGILDRYQLGHKVYYKFDAGKATKTLIISPPQK